MTIAISSGLADSNGLSSPDSTPLDFYALFAVAGITVLAIEIVFASIECVTTVIAIAITAAAAAVNKWIERFAGYARYTRTCFGFAALRFLKPDFLKQEGCSL